MANELVNQNETDYVSLSGINVTLTPEIVKSTLTRGNGKVTDQEVAMFIRTCQAKKLDPLENGECYLIKYDDKAPAQLVVGSHAYVRRADKFPGYRGYKAGITVLRNINNKTEVVQKEGCCLYKALGEELIGGWCRVYRQRGEEIDETFVEVSLDEYNTGKSNWNSKPSTMIRKVAVSQALRAAFPNDYEGIYTIEEMQASGAIPGNYSVNEETGELKKVIEVEDDENSVITQEQRQELFAYFQEKFGGKKEGNDVLRQILEAMEIESTANLTVSQIEEIKAKANAFAGDGEENEGQ